MVGKRKRDQDTVKVACQIVRSGDVSVQPAHRSTTARNISIQRQSNGRLLERTTVDSVDISPEEWNILEHTSDFISDASNTVDFDFFEHGIQELVGQDENHEHGAAEVSPSVGMEEVRLRPAKRIKLTPTEQWLPFRERYLEELVRHDGWVSETKTCAHCKQSEATHKCLDCFRLSNLCTSCMLLLHQHLPLHMIARWNHSFWVRTSLCDLGLIIQLGHDDGLCNDPMTPKWPLTIVHSNGVHAVRVAFCQCSHSAGGHYYGTQLLRVRWFPATMARPSTAFTFDALHDFHQLTLQGKTTGWDYYNSLAHKTDNTGLSPIPKRYNEFLQAIRWWRHLKMLKHAGRAHDPDGIAATKEGALAVECPACPHPGRNLPDGWETVDKQRAWIYTLFVAMDANFRLKLRDRGIKNDNELGPGWAYFVEYTRYLRIMEQFGDQKEVNTCTSGLHAVDHANTRFTKGCIANGVGNIVCARHTFVGKNSAADLAKGEKYCSMDYILLSMLMGVALVSIVVSYDIACQWSKNFFTRMGEFPPEMHVDTDFTNIDTVIPKFHIIAHGLPCQSRWSLNFRRWMGRTDGYES
ncbi:hypothetical protein BJ138DRAFT_1119717 [Hygrophoropsis aurantiaca]|uniref:Uncharacterized protein n=1 Tax=Hygrophoropsis aurantiaca TaxID=72124 RepID=A0ACB7ZTQ0_9AGAM|nr:hypothetical protein BJ138DRAFT_1119717 [Hygrophoropsis aurantiaca]